MAYPVLTSWISEGLISHVHRDGFLTSIGLDLSSVILIPRGGFLTSIGDVPQSLGQAILAGRMSVGRLGVVRSDSKFDSIVC